jgi:MFS family permease
LTQYRGEASAGTNAVSPLYPWLRLIVAVTLSTIGGVGVWSVVVVLPQVQAEFGVARGTASLPYTLTMLGFATASVFMGRLADRVGIFPPIVIGALTLALGLIAASYAPSLWAFALLQGALIGAGSSVTFAPLLADTSLWFKERRGLAVAIVASGNYFAGAIWPLVVAHFVQQSGWRATYFGIGIFCALTMLALATLLRRRAPVHEVQLGSAAATNATTQYLGLSPFSLQALLIVAGIACCVAMSMPQVHMVAYCGDLGYGAARGAQMLSVMLTCGIVSRLAFGWVSDHIGGLRTLLLGSMLQGVALLLFVPFDGLVSLYVISGLFGLFQGGIVPSYAIIVREYFSPREAGARISAVITATMVGMSLGGWMSGAIFDWTGSYRAAFLNGIAWNLLNLSIAFWLWQRVRSAAQLRRGAAAA